MILCQYQPLCLINLPECYVVRTFFFFFFYILYILSDYIGFGEINFANISLWFSVSFSAYSLTLDDCFKNAIKQKLIDLTIPIGRYVLNEWMKCSHEWIIIYHSRFCHCPIFSACFGGNLWLIVIFSNILFVER